MTSTDTADQILKTDVLGRVRSSRQRRERILDEFEGSGLSGAQFAKLAGVKYTTLATWVQARRKEEGKYPKSPPKAKIPPARWIEAVADAPTPASAGSALVIELPGGASMRVGDAAQAALAAALVKALQKDLPAC